MEKKKQKIIFSAPQLRWNRCILFNRAIIETSLLKYRRLPLVIFTIVTLVILWATLYPSDRLADIRIWDYDKIGHFLMFAVWTFLYGIVLAVSKQKKPNLWFILLPGLFYGVLIEVLQYVLPTNRSPEFWDFVADAIGALMAILILRFIFRRVFDEASDELHENVIA